MHLRIPRAGSLLLSLLTPILSQAAPWKSERSMEMRYQHLRLLSIDQDFKREEPVAGLEGRYKLTAEGIASQWQHNLGVNLGKSLKTRTNYQILNARSTLSMPAPSSTQTLTFGIDHTRGNDPINQPVELVLASDDPAPFTSIQLGFTSQHNFNPRHAIGIEIGLSHNLQGDFELQTQDAEFAYIYNASRLSTSKLRLRQSEQQGEDTEPYHQTQLAIDQLLALSPTLGFDGSVGYGIRRQGEQKGSGLLYLAALSYNTEHRSEDEQSEQNPFKAKKKQERADIKDNRGLRGVSVFRLGMSRASDQRRAGDPIFVADQIFASWGLSLNQNHGLQLGLQQTKSKDDVESIGGRLHEDSIDLSYRWNHEVGSDRQPMGGVWGIEGRAQATQDGEREYERQVYTMIYGLVF